jgi:small subunit ribosomal protein S2
MPRKKKTEEETQETEKEKEEKKEIKEDKEKKTETKEDKESEEDKKEKLKKLAEKAKELEAKIDRKPEEKDMKEKVKEGGKKKSIKSDKNLFPLDDYVKYSAHLGTKAVTPHMRKFVYKRRADGLAVLNTNSIDEKLKEAGEYLSGFAPEDVFIACKREAGWRAAKKFSEATGIKAFTKKYPAGIITNTKLTDFFEVELVIICDPWLDKNALNDAVRVKKPVIGLCDTNNLTTGITKVVPCNNKSTKSIGLILYLLAKEYLKAKDLKEEAKKLKLEEFTGVEEEKGASQGV